MVHFSVLFVTLSIVSASVQAAPYPLTKRIAQVISDSTTKWEAATKLGHSHQQDAAGGGQQCNPIAVNAFGTLLAAAGPCEQQDNADKMVDLAKQLNNDANMIKFAQIFAQQPRNTPTSQSVPYCQTAPKNSELNGLFQCQFQGADPKTFVGGIAVGGTGTIPFGMSAALNPAGSCPAHPGGPIADGTQLVDQVSSSGASSSSSGNSSSNTTSGTPSSVSAASAASGSSSSAVVAAIATTASSAVSATATASSSSSSNFKLQNGKDAQALNKKFQTLDANSTCTDGDQACIGTAFAQCVGGSFVETPCGSGLTCAALPLVNKAGTSITCTTQADAATRIAATGATGGVTGNDSSSGAGSSSATSSAVSSASTLAASSGSASSSSDFKLQNGKDAQTLNKKFQSLTADSSCTDGDQACIGSAFAQCVGGKFVQTQCSGGLTCAALPLVNKAGTSITCTTKVDAATRIAATGATGGVTGN
ncbi:hypothetical protein EW146_g1428 [Bondarzewia mesenterica]|uniref:Carbohydrate-binding module family 19 domain-containing protein n=1 Tax=Bondarzewia mesenterica TaxID=1095465 RepID=A0A4V3XG30_9AGAM|nr:hypothetical protein EW146_g1428 [Bondarzewia mesenterica]